MAARPPPRVSRPALTRSTEPRTTSDTLCRSSAAVPGLLSARVNFRVSAETGSSDSCDILAAASPDSAVRPGRAAARCALGAPPARLKIPAPPPACSPCLSPRFLAALPGSRPPCRVTPRGDPLTVRGPQRSKRHGDSLWVTVRVVAVEVPPCHQPPSAAAGWAASSGRGVRRGAGRGGAGGGGADAAGRLDSLAPEGFPTRASRCRNEEVGCGDLEMRHPQRGRWGLQVAPPLWSDAPPASRPMTQGKGRARQREDAQP